MTATATYKQTNVKWMPEIPSHWKIGRGKALFAEKSIKNFPNEPLLAASQKQGVVLKTMLEQRSMEALENFEIFKLVEVNDFVISLRSFEGGIEIAHFRGIISPVYNIFNFKQTQISTHNCNYFKYLFKSRMFIQELNIYKKGIRDGQSISYKEFAEILFPLPSVEEQIQIATYIKAKEEKINHFIAKKQRFIELLKEQRQSVIDEKLKINAEKIKVKYCVSKVGTGVTPTGGATIYKNSGVMFLRSQNVHNEGLKLDDVAYITEEIHSEMKGSQVQFGDVLINVTGASIGRCFVFDRDEEANVNQHVCILRPKQNVILSEFLMLQMQSERIQTLINMIEGASREGLTNNEVKNYFLFVPSIDDQKNIISEIKIETATIDKTIAKAEREIELIKEYKEAMIAEAVMGKINFNN